MKKHISQMSRDEIYYLESFIRRSRKFKPTDHSMKRVFNRKIPMWLVDKTIKGGDLLEFQWESMFEHRVLLMGKENRRKNCPCVVVDIRTGEIVTTFYKKVKYDQSTLNPQEYISNLDIIQTVMLGRAEFN
jgi:hypothetical protein